MCILVELDHEAIQGLLCAVGQLQAHDCARTQTSLEILLKL